MRVWNGDQLRRSRRAGTVLRIAPVAAVVLMTLLSVLSQHLGDDDPRRRLDQREV
jgi:hypothetical protein